MRRLLVIVGLLFTVGNHEARAQSTNLEGFQQLAWRCLGDSLPDTLHALRLKAPSDMPYLRSALVQRWQAQHRRLFAADSTTQANLSRFAYAVDEATVTYERASDARLRRAQHLALRYTLTAPDGELLADRRCRETRTDTVARAALSELDNEAFAETQADPPAPGGWRRYVKPTLLVAATAVSVLLFFSLRSGERGKSI